MLLGPAAGALLALGGCAGVRVEDFAGERPTLDLRQYFNGPLVAHGVFQDRSGRVVRRFVVQMTGTWNGDEGVLDEHFVYSDGRTERRVWRLRYEGEGRYSGSADDVVGRASGRAVGNALHWTYTLRLPYEGRTIDVDFDDWMFLVDERVMLNRAEMRKFGIRLGEVTLSFTRLQP
ncbi:DUF3833 domain-containing protein [Tepidimonas sp.]|uniref:DUF3833 domain-containing protein n=1 Tax=Tepidimonas sp. TaxID=2002775 RepID=UPI002FE07740